MVKKKTARQKVREKTTKEETTTKASSRGDGDNMAQDTASEWGNEEGGPNERASLKRKMANQLRFLSKLKETKRALSGKKTLSKKRRRSQSGKTLNDLSSLAHFLPRITSSESAPTTKILRSKAKQKIVVSETKQLAAVLAHPQFKSNPFAAIQQHLSNTLSSSTAVATTKPRSIVGLKRDQSFRKSEAIVSFVLDSY